jgi:hypothetical protein
MSVVVQLRGALGSNLFQYAIGRIIASKLGLSLACIRQGKQSSSTDSVGTLEAAREWFPNAALQMPGVTVTGDWLRFGLEQDGEGDPHALPLGRIVADGRRVPIWINGLFQRSEYFDAYRDELAAWYDGPDASCVMPGRNDVLLCVARHSTIALDGWVLPLSYYTGVLDRLKRVGDVFVCGSGLDERTLSRLKSYRPHVLEIERPGIIRLMSRFRRVVLANTPTCWWAGFLSSAELWGPVSTQGEAWAFRGYPGVELEFRKRTYHEVAVRGFARAQPFVTSNVLEGAVFRSGTQTAICGVDGRRVHLSNVSAADTYLMAVLSWKAGEGRQVWSGSASGLAEMVAAGLLSVTFDIAEPEETCGIQRRRP